MSLNFNIVDVFWTFQGEGFWSGRRALFIRLPACNLKCPWCDTEFNKFSHYSEEKLIEILNQEPAKFAIITGGEPLLNKQTPKIISLLKEFGFYIACETNGTQTYIDGIDWVTCSPKAFQKDPYFIHPGLKDHVREYKYVVDKDFDFNVIKNIDIFKNEDGTPNIISYYLSPEFSNLKESFKKIEQFIKENRGWRYSLQTHKFLGIK